MAGTTGHLRFLVDARLILGKACARNCCRGPPRVRRGHAVVGVWAGTFCNPGRALVPPWPRL